MIDGLKDRHRAAIIAAIAANPRVERAVLFGSRATGTYTADSDVDIALFGDGLTLTDQARLGAIIDDIPMAQSVDLILYRFIDNSALLDHIRAHGVVWHRRRGSEKTDRLHLLPKYRRALEALLREHLPDVEVWAYGSRVNGRSHDGSDLDLVLRSPGLVKIDLSQLAEFNQAVQESTVPFLVEARDWARLPESFQREIEREHVVLVGKDQGAADDWQSMPLGDCITINASTYTPSEAWPFINYLDTGNITENRVAEIQHLIPGKDKIPSRARRKVQPGDIVYSTVRPNQKHFGLLKNVPENFLASTGFTVIRGKNGLVDTDFVYWFLAQDHVVNRLHTIAEHSTSAYPSIRPADIEQLSVNLPPLPEQRAIAHILGTLDDKIELNRRMNETLEAMARALFKSWFVDFDPVRAKAALRRHRETAHANPLPLREGAGGGDASAPSIGRAVREGVPPPQPSPSRGEGEKAAQALRWEDIRRGYSPRTIERAKTLRQNQTDAEGLLWHYLRGKQLDGYKFRRQQPIGPYITDFACLSEKLLIELDGSQHAEWKTRDEERDAFLRQAGYRILRFWNNEVFKNCLGVLERIYAALHPHPSFAEESQSPQSPPLEEQLPPQSPPFEGEPPPRFPPPLRGRVRVGGDPSPKDPRLSTLSQREGDWTVKRARAYLDNMDPEIAALFPDRFVDSELGEIPEGWEVGVLDDAVQLIGGGTPRTTIPNYWDGDIPWYTAKDAPFLSEVFVLTTERTITQSGIENSSTNVLPAGTTIITARGTVGQLAYLGIPMAMNQTCYGIQGAGGYPAYFTYWSIRAIVDQLHRRTHGTIFDTITRQTFRLVETALVPVDLAQSFEIIIMPVMSRILENLNESRTLAALRDTLLPKLVPGELRISNVNIDFTRKEG